MGIMGERQVTHGVSWVKRKSKTRSCYSLCQATPLEQGISQIRPPLAPPWASPYSRNAPLLGHYITHNGLDPPAEKHLGDNLRVKGSNDIESIITC